MLWHSRMELSSFVGERRREGWLSRTHLQHSFHPPLPPQAQQSLPRKQISRRPPCKEQVLSTRQSTAEIILKLDIRLTIICENTYLPAENVQCTDQGDANQSHEFQQSSIVFRVRVERRNNVLSKYQAIGCRVSNDNKQAGKKAGNEILWSSVGFLELEEQ